MTLVKTLALYGAVASALLLGFYLRSPVISSRYLLDLMPSFAALMLGLASGDRIEMKNTAKEYGIHLKSVREYAREVLPQPVSR